MSGLLLGARPYRTTPSAKAQPSPTPSLLVSRIYLTWRFLNRTSRLPLRTTAHGLERTADGHQKATPYERPGRQETTNPAPAAPGNTSGPLTANPARQRHPRTPWAPLRPPAAHLGPLTARGALRGHTPGSTDRSRSPPRAHPGVH
ncbi:hypothetical protein GCM10010423_71340 [Streptomyces levis]|uniref:Uncharacterized protein n=1 Tax=Streptomyces levis TaxID=285566 RepID=A0ABN3P4D1_9ACTN